MSHWIRQLVSSCWWAEQSTVKEHQGQKLKTCTGCRSHTEAWPVRWERFSLFDTSLNKEASQSWFRVVGWFCSFCLKLCLHANEIQGNSHHASFIIMSYCPSSDLDSLINITFQLWFTFSTTVSLLVSQSLYNLCIASLVLSVHVIFFLIVFIYLLDLVSFCSAQASLNRLQPCRAFPQKLTLVKISVVLH